MKRRKAATRDDSRYLVSATKTLSKISHLFDIDLVDTEHVIDDWTVVFILDRGEASIRAEKGKSTLLLKADKDGYFYLEEIFCTKGTAMRGLGAILEICEFSERSDSKEGGGEGEGETEVREERDGDAKMTGNCLTLGTSTSERPNKVGVDLQNLLDLAPQAFHVVPLDSQEKDFISISSPPASRRTIRGRLD